MFLKLPGLLNGEGFFRTTGIDTISEIIMKMFTILSENEKVS